MQKSNLILLNIKSASKVLKNMDELDSDFYFLSEDYFTYIQLKNFFKNKFYLNTLSGEFDKALQEIKSQFLQLMEKINLDRSSYHWWSGPVASRSGHATFLIRDITYAFIINKILQNNCKKNVVVILDDNPLHLCLEKIGKNANYNVITKVKFFYDIFGNLKNIFFKVLKCLKFLSRSLYERFLAFKYLNPLVVQEHGKSKTIVIRSWFGDRVSINNAVYNDRNFGKLSSWLKEKGYNVWIMPTQLKLNKSIKNYYLGLQKVPLPILIPHHFLKIRDYFIILIEAYKYSMIKLDNVKLNDINIEMLFNGLFKKFIFFPDTSYQMLNRLKEKDIHIDNFCYAFESNTPEKQFLYGCRQYFPNAKIYGYQHTPLFQNNLTYQLTQHEHNYHPLPDKIICSGSKYYSQLVKFNYPKKLLTKGPNLRFEAVKEKTEKYRSQINYGENAILVPLTFSHSLAFDLLQKIQQAFEDVKGIKIFIRTHPDLNVKRIHKFIKEINLSKFEFANEGSIQERFPSVKAMISNGGSVTILEAIVCGLPVIRIVPDNSIFLDPFSWSSYPLKPINKAFEIVTKMQQIEKLLLEDPNVFKNIGKNVCNSFFKETHEKEMRVFL